jgi:hypothetical protein
MRDLDSAVGRLDNIFMTLYVFIALLIIAVSLVSHTTRVSDQDSKCWLLLGHAIEHAHHWMGNRRLGYVLLLMLFHPSALINAHPDRSELAHWFLMSRSSVEHYLPIHQAPIRYWYFLFPTLMFLYTI